jgi:surface antigen Omp85-like protein
MTMRSVGLTLLYLSLAIPAGAQEPATRAAAIEREQADKAQSLHPFQPDKIEAAVNHISDIVFTGQLHWHPFWTSAYSGGGFTLGAGYLSYVSPYNMLDVRGSITFSGYKRIEAQFLAPMLFKRRATLAVTGGWREATEVGFYGIGTHNTSVDNRANYGFKQPYASALLDVRPTRGVLTLRPGFELTQWQQGPPTHGSQPSVDEIYSASALPGLNAAPVYAHSQVTVGVDTRAAAGYARRGGLYAVTAHDFADNDSNFGFDQIDYEVIQHIPLLREAWVVSLHGRVQSAQEKDGQTIPFFMLPALGGGDDLRAFSSWRFRDRNSLLLQGEWRVMVNRFFDTAVFYDAGMVQPRLADLSLNHMKNDYGIGFRFHGPTVTPLRIEFGTGNEGFALIFAASQVF